MAITLDGSNGIGTPDLESIGQITGTTGTFSGNVTANGLSTELRPLVSGTAQASTSGTVIDFTGIPSWVKRLTVVMSGVSVSGTSLIAIQLGDSGGVETTGYSGAGGYFANAGASSVATYSTGFTLAGSAGTSSAAFVLDATAVITKVSGSSEEWVLSYYGGLTGGAQPGAIAGGGRKTLSDTLDRIRVTTVNGTDTFDAGTINIMYE